MPDCSRAAIIAAVAVAARCRMRKMRRLSEERLCNSIFVSGETADCGGLRLGAGMQSDLCILYRKVRGARGCGVIFSSFIAGPAAIADPLRRVSPLSTPAAVAKLILAFVVASSRHVAVAPSVKGFSLC